MSEPIAQTAAGRVRGAVVDGCVRFLGVPYAEPPFGPNRFAAPAPAEPWDGVRDALEPAPTAPQPEQGFTIIPEPVIDGGDAPSCLSLNVFTPDLGAAGLPVLVWIHGGGFTSGTPSSPWYDGRSFARAGVVVVSVGYRLGAEGFLHLRDAPANRGVLDWLAALSWVQDNIASFGGDPGQVTIGGQSAGGIAVCTLLGLPQARGLFRRGIAMSGSIMPPASLARLDAIAAAIADELAVPCDREGLAAVAPADLVAVQATAPDADELPDHPGHEVAARLLHRPYADGAVVPVEPIDAMLAGATDHVDLLLGATAEEMTPLGGQDMTDTAFRVPGIRVAEARSRGGAATYHYDFRWGAAIGAIHCIDIPFAWDLLEAEAVEVVCGDAPPQSLADAMHGSFVDFISGKSPGWTPYDTETRTTMIFDGDGARPADDALVAERQRFA